MKKLNKKYADLMRKAQKATGRKEAVGLIHKAAKLKTKFDKYDICLLYTSPSPRDRQKSRMPSSA